MKPWLIVVDDDMDDLQFIREAIGKFPESPKTYYFTSGTDLLQFLGVTKKPLPPMIITLDINMPGTDGLELLHVIKNNPLYSHIPVYIISTSSSTWHIDQSTQKGATDYFVKPAEPKMWREIIAKILFPETQITK
jgi:CheY-like chemotaxis protein